MKIIFSRLNFCFFPENRGEQNKKMSVLDDSFLLQYF